MIMDNQKIIKIGKLVRAQVGSEFFDKAFKIDGTLSILNGYTSFDMDNFMDCCEVYGMGDDESAEDFCKRKFGDKVTGMIMKLLDV